MNVIFLTEKGIKMEDSMEKAILDKKYWLCCGSLHPGHKGKRANSCFVAKEGHPERCRFGTAEEHGIWQAETEFMNGVIKQEAFKEFFKVYSDAKKIGTGYLKMTLESDGIMKMSHVSNQDIIIKNK